MASPIDKLKRDVVDLLLDAVFLVDEHGCIVWVNAACERIFGYTPQEMTGRTMIDLVAPEDRDKTRSEARLVMAGIPRIGFENRYVRKDGNLVHVMWSASWSPQDRMRIGVARDITEHKRAEELQNAVYAVSEAAHAPADLPELLGNIHLTVAGLVSAPFFAVAMVDAASGAVTFPYQTDLTGAGTAGRDAAVRMLVDSARKGRPTLLASEELDAALPAGAAERASWLALPLPGGQGPIGALVMKSSPGVRYGPRDEELLQYVATQVAVAIEQRRMLAELTRAARHDDLTGLPNRRLFHDRLASALARARRRAGSLAILYIDIDDFKQVNDTLGHAAGDLFLCEVARRLRQAVREEDTVARLGGDEFVVLLESVNGREDAALVAGKLGALVDAPYAIAGATLRNRASVGIAVFPDDGDDGDRLLARADRGMYAAKNDGARSDRPDDTPAQDDRAA